MPPQAPLGWDSFSAYSEISDLGSLQEGWPRVLKTIPQLECVWCFSYESYMDSTCVLPKTHRLKLNAHVILWGSRPPGGDQVLTGGRPLEWDSCPYKKRPENEGACLPSCGDTARSLLPATQKRTVLRPSWLPDLKLPASRAVSDYVCALRPTSLWCFVVTARVDHGG